MTEETPKRKQMLLRLDPAVHDALARWASDELRSANAQIEFLLRRALAEAGRLPTAASPSLAGAVPPSPRRSSGRENRERAPGACPAAPDGLEDQPARRSRTRSRRLRRTPLGKPDPAVPDALQQVFLGTEGDEGNRSTGAPAAGCSASGCLSFTTGTAPTPTFTCESYAIHEELL